MRDSSQFMENQFMENQLRERLLGLVGAIKGREVFYVYAGPSTGSIVDIHFCPTKPRSKPLANPDIAQVQRENMGQLSLYAECAWRLQERGRILAASGDALRDSEATFFTLGRLEGVKVLDVVLPSAEGPLDIGLVFQNGLQLIIFCDCGVADCDNYTVFDDDQAIIVVGGCDVRLES